MNELKPINCPMCNAKSIVRSSRQDHNYKIAIKCDKCDVKLEKSVTQGSATVDLIAYLSKVRRELIIQWNTRIKN